MLLLQIGMKRSFPAKRKGLTQWKVKSVDYVQDFVNEALFLECSFYGMEGNVLNGLTKILILRGSRYIFGD